MTILAFLAVCIAGLFATLLTGPWPRASRIVSLAALTAALVAALSIDPNDSTTLGGVQLQATPFAEDFLTALVASSLLLSLVGLLTGWAERLAPAALAVMAGVTVAITSLDPTVSLAAAAAATTPAALVASRVRSTPLGVTVGTAELRTLALVVAASLLAALTILTNISWNGDPTSTFALAFLVLAGAVAVRSGVFPFHVPAALLSRSGEGLGLVLSLVWVPAGFALVALSWNASIFGVPGDWLDRSVVVVQIVAVATLVLGAVGAMLHDEVEEVAVYSVVQDAGFILLALTARSEDASSPARLWLVAFVIAKSALVAWAAAISWAFNTSSLRQLRGWLRRSPVLGLALVVIVVATLGWPGSPVYEARTTLVNLGLPAPMHFVGLAAILLSLSYYGRLAVVGLLAPSEAVREAGSGWFRRARITARDLAAVEPAGPVVKAATVADVLAPATASALNAAEMRPAKASRHGPAEIADARRGGSLGHQLTATWRLNKPLQAAALVLIISALAAGVALGGFAVSDAAWTGIALDQAAGLAPTATTGASAQPSDQPSATPGLPFVPGSSASPLGSAAPSPSDGGGSSPIDSPTPTPSPS
jgi:multicomponent Na+:H+ antiporter subunit D